MCRIIGISSDEWSYRVAEKPTPCYDVYATVPHLLGIDHEKRIFRHPGLNGKLLLVPPGAQVNFRRL